MGIYARAKKDLAYTTYSYSRVNGDHFDLWYCNGFNPIYLSYFLMNRKLDIHYRDLLISGLAIGLFYWFFPANWILICGGTLLALGLIFDLIRKLNHLFWDRLTKGMQWIVQPILGTLIFCLILVPVGLMWRVFKKKMNLSSSTFRPVEKDLDADFFKKQW